MYGPTSGLMEGSVLPSNALYCSSYDESNPFCNKLGAFFNIFLLVYFHVRLFNDVSQLRELYAIQ